MNLLEQTEQARDRGGEAKEDRPDGVSDLIEQSEQLGYGNGDPLGTVDSYQGYPDTKEEFYWPEAGPLLASIAQSDCITDIEAMSQELDFSATVLGDMCQFHNISIPRESENEPSPLREVPDGEGGTTTANVNKFAGDFPTAYHLYAELGMGVSELSTFLDQSESEVMNALENHNLI